MKKSLKFALLILGGPGRYFDYRNIRQPHPRTEAKVGNLIHNEHNLYSNLIWWILACPARFEGAKLGFSYRKSKLYS
jgi:hypothetical protein